MQKFKGGELAAQFPPQGCGPAPPPEVGVAGGAAHVDVDYLGGGVEGCCPAHNIIHPHCPRQVRRLLQLMVGDGEGLVVGEDAGCGVGARGQVGEMDIVCWDIVKRECEESSRAVRKPNSRNEGKCVQNSYEIGTKFVRISHSRECVNLT